MSKKFKDAWTENYGERCRAVRIALGEEGLAKRNMAISKAHQKRYEADSVLRKLAGDVLRKGRIKKRQQREEEAKIRGDYVTPEQAYKERWKLKNARQRAKKLGLPLPPLRPPKPGSVAALRLLPPQELSPEQRRHLATLDRIKARRKEKRAKIAPQTTASSSGGAIASSPELPSGNI